MGTEHRLVWARRAPLPRFVQRWSAAPRWSCRGRGFFLPRAQWHCSQVTCSATGDSKLHEDRTHGAVFSHSRGGSQVSSGLHVARPRAFLPYDND